MLATIALGAAQVWFLKFPKKKYHFDILQNINHSLLPFLFPPLLQSPWGVASGAIAGHLVATSIAILGGAFLANYISEKLVSATTVLLAIKN